MSAREFLRAVRRAFGLAGVILAGFFHYQKARRAGDDRSFRLAWMQGMSRSFLRLLDGEVQIRGAVPRHGLVVSNHLSYVDILVIGSICPAVFVAKSDVRHWPVFGGLSEMAGTIFVERGWSRTVRDQLAEILRPLEEGFPVVLFPEGTSSDGSRVLPFHSSLLEAARMAEQRVTPCAIRYELGDGSVGRDVCYWGDMAFAAHLFKLLSKKSLRASVSFGGSRPMISDRKREAVRFHTEVTGLLSSCAL